MTTNAPSDSTVVVIDDDDDVRAAIKGLLDSVGLKVILFASAGEFLESTVPDTTCCMVLDVRMPRMSGLKLQEELARADVHIPIVFITGHGDIAMAVRAMKAGAVDFLTKPFNNQDLLDAVFAALERDRTRRTQWESISVLRDHSALSVREKEVLTTGCGPAQQADRSRSRHQRSHGEGASRQRDAEDAYQVGRRAGQDDRIAAYRPSCHLGSPTTLDRC
jgi:FixJ family two-component response regulator